ncbi:MAG: hypothetical protein WC551_13265 [Patescibacteria group bacterium]
MRHSIEPLQKAKRLESLVNIAATLYRYAISGPGELYDRMDDGRGMTWRQARKAYEEFQGVLQSAGHDLMALHETIRADHEHNAKYYYDGEGI